MLALNIPVVPCWMGELFSPVTHQNGAVSGNTLVGCRYGASGAGGAVAGDVGGGKTKRRYPERSSWYSPQYAPRIQIRPSWFEHGRPYGRKVHVMSRRGPLVFPISYRSGRVRKKRSVSKDPEAQLKPLNGNC